uniref:Ubiquitin conjugating enzyme E2 L6 n=1 Tax=Propithecus coquereli TaxID=379532 RepID=A0A2K6GIA6_PROCO
MTASKRVAKELEDLQKKPPQYLRNLFSDDANVLVWHALLLPLEALNVLVNKPNLGEPLRVELADLLTQNPELFRRNAEEFTLQFGVDRPK